MYTVSDLFNSALSVFSGTTANAFIDKQVLVWDALRAVRRNVDAPEAKRVVPLNPVLVEGDFMYTEPDDVDVPLGILPAQGRQIGGVHNTMNRVSVDMMNNNFNSNNLITQYTREYRMGVPLLRINSGIAPVAGQVLQNFVSLTENGTITVAGDGSNEDISEVWFLTDNASLAFDIAQATGTTTVTSVMTGTQIKDISDIAADGAFTASIFIPKELIGKITNIKLRLGNDAGNYIEGTVSANSYGGVFTEGFNDIIFSRRLMTETGTVDDSAISYLQVRIAHTMGTGVVARGVRIDNVKASRGSAVLFSYYSKYWLIDAITGAFMDKPVSSGLSEKLILSKDTFDLAVLELQKILDMKRAGNNQSDIYRNAQRDLFGLQGVVAEEGAYKKYKRRFPSERQPQITRYVS
jgi:hypothetical protein